MKGYDFSANIFEGLGRLRVIPIDSTIIAFTFYSSNFSFSNHNSVLPISLYFLLFLFICFGFVVILLPSKIKPPEVSCPKFCIIEVIHQKQLHVQA